MKKYKKLLLTLLIMVSYSVSGESSLFSDFQNTEITEVNVGTSTVYINNRAYLYKPDKKNSLYRSTDSESIAINKLQTDKKYYIEILMEETESVSGFIDKPIAIVFISDQAPPE